MSQREKRETDRYAEKRSVCGGLFFKNARRWRKLRNVVFILSRCFVALMFISDEIGLEQVTHDAQRREGGGATQPRLNTEIC